MIAAVFVAITSCGIRDNHFEGASWDRKDIITMWIASILKMETAPENILLSIKHCSRYTSIRNRPINPICSNEIEINYSAGSAHPSTCFSPVTIEVKTRKTVTPEDVLNKSWDAIKTDIQTTESEKDFNADYGFYLTQHTLTYIHRFNVFVDPIVINR